MKIRRVMMVVVLMTLLTAGAAYAAVSGGLEPTDPPGSTGGFTLEQVYQAVSSDSANNASPQTAFTEPSSGPGSTMHTLDEIMAVLIGQVPKTGQTKCYDPTGTTTDEIPCDGTGQDADYRMGSLPVQAPTSATTGAYTIASWEGERFTDNGNETVTDNVTGLIWLKNANCFGQKNWATALSDANGLASGSCDLNDGSSAGEWRLPNVNELHSLIDLTQSYPALPSGHPFTVVQTNYYWSSTSNAANPNYAWNVYLSSGYVGPYNKTGGSYVWPVRGGQ